MAEVKKEDNRYRIHNELVNKTLIYLSSQGLGTFWSNPTGAHKLANGHFQRFGLKGSSDIIGISKTGQFVAIEVKTGSARQSKHQIAFEKMILRNNGLYYIIRAEEQLPVLALVIKGEV